jgi:hypothetical protein
MKLQAQQGYVEDVMREDQFKMLHPKGICFAAQLRLKM